MKCRSILVVALACSLCAPCFAQNSQLENSQLDIQRRQREIQHQIAEINAREFARESAAIKAERERLLNLPLDEDLIRVCKDAFWRSKKWPANMQLKFVQDTRISMAKIQETRNLAK